MAIKFPATPHFPEWDVKGIGPMAVSVLINRKSDVLKVFLCNGIVSEKVLISFQNEFLIITYWRSVLVLTPSGIGCHDEGIIIVISFR